MDFEDLVKERRRYSRMSNSNATPTSINLNSTRSKTDITWEHCKVVDDSTGKGRTILKCNYCPKIYYGGGIHRMKEHLGHKKGDAQACPSVPAEIQYQIDCSLRNVKVKKERNCDSFEISPMTIDGEPSEEDQNIYSPVAKNNESKSALATKDKFLEEPIGKWMYDARIPLNATNSYYFQPMIDAIKSIGLGYKAPSYHDIRGSILKETVTEVKKFIETFRSEWEKKGCTIMADGWTNKRNRTLINFFVNCPKGTVFWKSIDVTTHSKTGKKLFDIFKEVVEFVGAENVVQLITDNATNYMAAGELFVKEFPRIFWSSCVANCIGLMLEEFEKLQNVKLVIDKAREVTKFIYNDNLVLNLMKRYTNGNEMILPPITRFATNFLTLESLSNNKDAFQKMVISKEWLESKWSKCSDGKEFAKTILSSDFWTSCELVSKIGEPLVKILLMVDTNDRPAMGYIFEGMQIAREEVKKAFKGKKEDYLPFLNIIDRRWDDQLHAKLPVAGYWLNPKFFYDKNTFPLHDGVMSQVLDCIEKMYVDDESKQMNIINEIKLYKEASGDFGRPIAINARNKMHPADWWENFGESALNLQEMAIRILSQTCKSSGCERNWSVFEKIHTIKRNRLEYQRLNDLIFVQYNLRLANRNKKNKCYDPISFEDMDIRGDWVDTSCLVLQDEQMENLLEMDQLPMGDQAYENPDFFRRIESLAKELLVEPEEQMAIDLPVGLGNSWSSIASDQQQSCMSASASLSEADLNKSNMTSEESSIIETKQEEKGPTDAFIGEKGSAIQFDFAENNGDFSIDEVPLMKPHEIFDRYIPSPSSISSSSSFTCSSRMPEDLHSSRIDSRVPLIQPNEKLDPYVPSPSSISSSFSMSSRMPEDLQFPREVSRASFIQPPGVLDSYGLSSSISSTSSLSRSSRMPEDLFPRLDSSLDEGNWLADDFIFDFDDLSFKKN